MPITFAFFAYPQFAAPVHDRVRENAEALAAEAGITIEYIPKKHVRKEAVVATVPERRTKELGPRRHRRRLSRHPEHHHSGPHHQD